MSISWRCSLKWPLLDTASRKQHLKWFYPLFPPRGLPYGMFPSFFASITLSLIPFPCLIHLFLPSGLLISLQPLFSTACPSLVLKQSFIHTSFCPLSYPRAKVHFDFLLPNSFHAPFSPCTFINSFFSPIASLSIFSSLAFAPSSLAPRFLLIHSLKISSILCLFKFLHHILLSTRSLNSPLIPLFLHCLYLLGNYCKCKCKNTHKPSHTHTHTHKELYVLWVECVCTVGKCVCILSLSDNILINNRQMMEESTNILCTMFCVFTPHKKMDVGTKTGEVIELSRTESDQFSLSVCATGKWYQKVLLDWF